MVKMQHQPQKADGRHIQHARTDGENKSLEEDEGIKETAADYAEKNWKDRRRVSGKGGMV